MITFGYDNCLNGVGRLCTATHPNSVLTSTYQYDAEGNAVNDNRVFKFAGFIAARVSKFTYGPSGRITTQTYGDHSTSASNGTVARFEYDERALPKAIKWQNGAVLRTVAKQARNPAGLVTTRYTEFQTAGWNESQSNWTYDALTRVKSQQIVQGQSGGLAVELAKQELDYFGQDDPQRLRHWLRRSPTSTGYYDMTFGYDQRHQLSTVSESGGRFVGNYHFSDAGKLTRAHVGGAPGPGHDVFARDVDYLYDPLSSDPDAPVGLKERTTGSYIRYYTYDATGNMQYRFGGGTPFDTFTYDGEDQLRRVTSNGSLEEYFYDHSGNRVGIVKRNASNNAVVDVRVFFGDAEVVYSAGGTLTKSFAHLSLGTPVAKVTNRTDLELQYHGLANSTLMSVTPSGTTKSGFVYGPFGELLEATGTALADQHRRFNDKYRDDLTKLSYYGARYYDGVMLGWTQADPLYRFSPDGAWSEPRRANLYSFSGQNPLRYMDPDGRDFFGDAVNVVGSVGESMVRETISKTPAVQAYRQVSRVVDVGSGKKSAGTALVETGIEMASDASALAGGSGLRAAVLAAGLAGGATVATGGSIKDAAQNAAIAAGVTVISTRLVGAVSKALKGCGCFATGTLVSSANGAVPIENLREGDMVWAQDVLTREVRLKPILSLFRTEEREIVVVTIRGPAGEVDDIRTTDDHPFWTSQGWVETAGLREGEVVALDGGEIARVVEITATGKRETVYNFEVDEFHTYFVGDLEALVHNCPTGRRVGLRKGTLAKIEAAQPRNADGQMISPNTKEPLVPGQIDVGHKPGNEWRTRKQMHEELGSTRKQVIEAENDATLYHLEPSVENRSHKYEKKGSID